MSNGANPDVDQPVEFHYRGARGESKFPSYAQPRSLPQLQSDLNLAHDNLKRQVKINDWNSRALAAAKRRLDVAGWKIWALMLVLAGQGAVIGWLVKFVLEHAR